MAKRPAIKGLYAITPDETDSAELLRKARLALQGGVRVLQYRNKSATAALKRQQAQALVDARKIVVEGAVEIVDDAMTRLKDRGIDIEPAHRSKVVGNLLAIICGDAKVQPTYAIQDYENDAMTENMQKMVELLDGIKTQLAGKAK